MNESTPPKTSSSKLLILSVIINVFLLLLMLALAFLFVLNNNILNDLQSDLENNYVTKQKYDALESSISNNIVPMEDPTPDDTPLMAYEPVTFSGVIKKENIPAEYQLGEFWYVFYFDTPQLIESGEGETYKDSLVIQASTIDSLEPYLEKNVTVNGRLTWGVAETRMILADEVIVVE